MSADCERIASFIAGCLERNAHPDFEPKDWRVIIKALRGIASESGPTDGWEDMADHPNAPSRTRSAEQQIVNDDLVERLHQMASMCRESREEMVAGLLDEAAEALSVRSETRVTEEMVEAGAQQIHRMIEGGLLEGDPLNGWKPWAGTARSILEAALKNAAPQVSRATTARREATPAVAAPQSAEQVTPSELADEIESVGKGLAIMGRSIEGGRVLLPEEDALVLKALRSSASLPEDSTVATALRLLRKRIPSHGTFSEEMLDAFRIIELALMPKAPQSSAALPEGWKLVPCEPTEAMVEAGDLFFTNASFVNVSPAQISRIYSDMLGAAPEAPLSASRRILFDDDAHCPGCGHNRDRSSVSTIKLIDGRRECQMCGALWMEISRSDE